MSDGPDQPVKNQMAVSRRRFLGRGVCAAAAAALFPAPASARLLLPSERTLSFYNIHTGEYLQATYWTQGRYAAEALEDINFLLRDYRDEEIKPIATNLLDVLYALNRLMKGTKPFHVVSGYRSP